MAIRQKRRKPLPRPPRDRYREQYGVIVIVGSEAQQRIAYGRLVGLGYSCRVVVT